MLFSVFASRRRHTRCALVTVFRRVLFRSPRHPPSRRATSAAGILILVPTRKQPISPASIRLWIWRDEHCQRSASSSVVKGRGPIIYGSPVSARLVERRCREERVSKCRLRGGAYD